MFLALILIGYSAGIVTGVVVDVDTVYETTIKRIKQKNSPDGTIVVDVDTGEQVKTKKEIRKEDREIKKAIREKRRDRKKTVKEINHNRAKSDKKVSLHIWNYKSSVLHLRHGNTCIGKTAWRLHPPFC